MGVLIKLALFPFHVWLPNAYAYAPSMVSAFLAATATKVGAYMLLRFVFTVFGVHFAFETLPLTEVLLALSLVAVLAGSLVAVFQTDPQAPFWRSPAWARSAISASASALPR